MRMQPVYAPYVCYGETFVQYVLVGYDPVEEDELMPCPHCSGEKPEVVWSHKWGRWTVRCRHCGFEAIDLSRTEAIEKWNTRPFDFDDDEYKREPNEGYD